MKRFALLLCAAAALAFPAAAAQPVTDFTVKPIHIERSAPPIVLDIKRTREFEWYELRTFGDREPLQIELKAPIPAAPGWEAAIARLVLSREEEEDEEEEVRRRADPLQNFADEKPPEGNTFHKRKLPKYRLTFTRKF